MHRWLVSDRRLRFVVAACWRAEAASRRWVMSHTTSVSAVSGSLWRVRWPRRTGQIPSRSVGSVSSVSSCLAASGLQIGLQNRLLICTFPHPPRPSVAAVPGARHCSRPRQATAKRRGLDTQRVASAHARHRAARRPVVITATGSALGHRRTTACPDTSPEPDCCRTWRQTGSVQGRRSRSRSDAEGALDRFRLAW